MRHFKRLSLFTFSAFVFLTGCSKPLEFMYTFSDSSQYAISFNPPADPNLFAKKLEAWCSEAGYVPASLKEYSIFLNSKDPNVGDPLKFRMSRVIYLDPTRPRSGILLTYQEFPGSDGTMLVRLHAFREGSKSDTRRQEQLIKQQKDTFEAAFPELK